MESSLISRFTPNPALTRTSASSPLLPRCSLRLGAPPRSRRRHIRLSSSSPRGPSATDDGEGEGEVGGKTRSGDPDLRVTLGKVLDAYRGSDNDLRTFLRNLVDAGVVDESEVFGGEEGDLLRRLVDADLPGGDPSACCGSSRPSHRA
ncbi:hypothetical protein ACP4OV_000844 [Aristida adscensionis]